MDGIGAAEFGCPDVFISWLSSAAEAGLVEARNVSAMSAAASSRKNIFRTKDPLGKDLSRLP
jgi:hypothetical protein